MCYVYFFLLSHDTISMHDLTGSLIIHQRMYGGPEKVIFNIFLFFFQSFVHVQSNRRYIFLLLFRYHITVESVKLVYTSVHVQGKNQKTLTEPQLYDTGIDMKYWLR